MTQPPQEHYISIVGKRIGFNFLTGKFWLDDEPELGTIGYTMAEGDGEEFTAKLPEVVLWDELQAVEKLIRKKFDLFGKTATIQAMADIEHHVQFLYSTQPEAAWEKYREGRRRQKQHQDMLDNDSSD